MAVRGPKKSTTPSKASCACPFQAAASHSAAWVGRRALFSITNLLSLSCFYNSQDAPESIPRYTQTHISALPIHAGRNCQELNREREREKQHKSKRERNVCSEREKEKKTKRHTQPTARLREKERERQRDFISYWLGSVGYSDPITVS